MIQIIGVRQNYIPKMLGAQTEDMNLDIATVALEGGFDCEAWIAETVAER